MVVLLGAAGTLILVALYVVALVVLGVIWALFGTLAWLIERKPRRRYIPRGPGREIPARPPYQYSARARAKRAARLRTQADQVSAPAQTAAPTPTRVPGQPTSEIWPKWGATHRRYMDGELTQWQEQFDALDSSARPKAKPGSTPKSKASGPKSQHRG